MGVGEKGAGEESDEPDFPPAELLSMGFVDSLLTRVLKVCGPSYFLGPIHSRRRCRPILR